MTEQGNCWGSPHQGAPVGRPHQENARAVDHEHPGLRGTPVVGALYATPDGSAYRCRQWRTHPMYDDGRVQQTWVVNLPTGATTNRDTLPDNATLIWSPGVTHTERCGNCGTWLTERNEAVGYTRCESCNGS